MYNRTTIKNIIGRDVCITSQQIEDINKWYLMWQGRAGWIKDDIVSTKTEKAICREFTNCVLSEFNSLVEDKELDKIYQIAIRDLDKYLQIGLALGSFIIKPISSKAVQLVTAYDFVPVEFDSTGKLTKVVFIDKKQLDEHRYKIRYEYHHIERNGLIIENKVYLSFDGVTPIKPLKLDTEFEWSILKPKVEYTGMFDVDFGYFRVNKFNDYNNAVGVSIYADAVKQIEKLDIQSSRLDWEYSSGERALYLDETVVKKDNTVNKSAKRLYKKLDSEDDFFKEWSPTLRDENYIKGLNEYKRDIEFIVGLSYGDLSKPEDVTKTAEEVKNSKIRKYETVKGIKKTLEDTLQDLVKALAMYNGKYTQNIDFKCNFGDSILNDEFKEKEQDRLEVSQGLMTRVEYRMKHYKETEEEARRHIEEIQEEEIID